MIEINKTCLQGPVEDAELCSELINPDGFSRPLELSAALRDVGSGAAELALTGRAFQKLLNHSRARPQQQEVFELAMQRCSVWARMSPDDKRALIEMLGAGEVDSDGVLREGAG